MWSSTKDGNMSWFATLFGGTIGFLLGGPLGALAGVALGRMFSRDAQRTSSEETDWFHSDMERMQATYFVSLFTLLGKIAKADGIIQKEEGRALLAFLDEMRLQGKLRQFAINLFNHAKESQYSVQELAQQFRAVSGQNRDLRRSMVDMLYRLAMSDGKLHPKEEEIISIVVIILGIGDNDVEHIRKKYGADANKSYHILEVSPNASNDEVRSSYRRLAKEYHPDYALARGMPDEFITFANQRFREVQEAWDAVRKERGIS